MRLDNALVTTSIIVGVIVISWAWLSAYCEYSGAKTQAVAQSDTTHYGDQRALTFRLCCQWNRAQPSDEPANRTDRASGLMNILNIAFIGVAAVAAVLTWLVYRNIRDHNKIIERAYVDISHCPPGLEFNNPMRRYVQITLKNHGKTPATVIAYNITFWNGRGPLPIKPEYDERLTTPIEAFINPDESIFDDVNPLRKGGSLQIGEGSTLLLFGYVDYIDQFGDRHRSGYGRTYIPARDLRENYPSDDRFNNRSNLDFVTQPGYNYDIEIDGQGNPKK